MSVHYSGQPYGLVDIWKLNKRVNESKLASFDMPINDIKECLKQTLWDNDTGTDIFSPIDVLEGKVNASEHWERIQNCDSSFPILIFEEAKNSVGISSIIKNPSALKDLVKINLLDGNHRVAQRILLKYKTIPAISVPWDLIKECLITTGKSVYTYSRLNSISGRTK